MVSLLVFGRLRGSGLNTGLTQVVHTPKDGYTFVYEQCKLDSVGNFFKKQERIRNLDKVYSRVWEKLDGSRSERLKSNFPTHATSVGF